METTPCFTYLSAAYFIFLISPPPPALIVHDFRQILFAMKKKIMQHWEKIWNQFKTSFDGVFFTL